MLGRNSLLSDISQLIQSQPIKWDQVLEQARELGIRRIVDVNFILAQNLLGMALPSSLRKPEVAEVIARKIMLKIAESQEVDTESASYFRLMLDLRERLRDRVRFLWRLISTPSMGEWEMVQLPPWLSPLYHVVRMYRLARRLLRAVLRLIAGQKREGTTSSRAVNLSETLFGPTEVGPSQWKYAAWNSLLVPMPRKYDSIGTAALKRLPTKKVDQLNDQNHHDGNFQHERSALIELVDHEAIKFFGGLHLLRNQILVVRYADLRRRQFV